MRSDVSEIFLVNSIQIACYDMSRWAIVKRTMETITFYEVL